MAHATPFRITLVVENGPATPPLEAEHGLSFFVQTAAQAGLFDTGQGDLALRNLRALALADAPLDWVALSHGHYDHSGGLKPLLASGRRPRLYAHPAAFEPKAVREQDGSLRQTGLSVSRGQACEACTEVIETASPTWIGEGLLATGEIPRHTPYETVSERFLVQRGGHWVHDVFPDDQALVFTTGQGLVVLLGCAHAGVVNTLEHVMQITGERRLRAVIGGLHLAGAPEERITQTIGALAAMQIGAIYPLHCTGEQATTALREAFGERFQTLAIGQTLQYDA